MRGHAADLLIAVMLIEGVWLTTKAGWRVSNALCRLAPGVFLALALKAAMTGAGWPWIAAALMLSLPFHLADLRRGKGS